ncbi:MAG: hypothetical protein AAF433_21560 [Bacteroidota bacterium]
MNNDNDVSGNGNNGEDEDDHDVASIEVLTFDLALIKELADGQSSSVEPGDTVRYTITVFNQGDIAADNIEISDYIPEDMAYEAGAGDGVTDNTILGWTEAGGIATNTLLIDGGLQPDSSTTIDIFLTLNSPLLPPGTVIDNFAEISDATDENGDEQEDVDSELDDNPDDDDLTSDNETGGNGNIPGEDDDDHDVASITIEGFDLALIKLLADDQPAQVRPGDTIHYRIRVINQGMIAADQIEVIDYLPADGSLIYEGGIAGNDDAGWDGSGGDPVRTLSVANGGLTTALEPGDSTEVSIFLTLANPLPAGAMVDNFAEITAATDENGDPQDDIDSTPDDENDDTLTNDNDVSGDGNEGEDEDDHDIATVEVLSFDLALIKELADGQSDLVAPGDTVRYTITVFNQGDIAADNIEISDYIPEDMTFESGAGDGVTDNTTLGWTEAGGIATNTLLIDGGLQPDSSTTIDIFLTLNNPLPAGAEVANFAEISDATDENGDEQEDDDSEYDDNPDDDDLTSDNETGGNGDIPGEDDDDHDVAVITTATFDLALIKQLGPDQDMSVEPGDTIEYVITIINQGEIAADSIEITDYLPENMFFEGDIVGNEDWMEAAGLVTRTLEVGDELTEPLAPEASFDVSLFLTLDNPLPAGTVIDNFAEISGATDDTGDAQEDDDSEYDQDPDDDTLTDDNEVSGNGDNPGEDDDDHDIATVVIEAFDLALIKTLADGQSVSVEAGDTVYFTLTVLNQGMIAADSILLSDYVPSQVDGFMWDPTIDVNADAGWMQVGTIGPDTLLVQTTLTVADGDLDDGGLAPGDFVTVDIALVVNPAMEAVMELTNLAEISDATDENGDEVVDVDSPMDDDPFNDNFFEDNEVQGNGLEGEDEDNSDPASIFVGGFDLALIKELAEGESNVVAPGDEVTFDITVLNQGAIIADSIVITDYLPDGFLFDPAFNPDWTDNGDSTVTDTLSVAEGTLVDGGLEPGESTTVQITLTVAPPMFPDYAFGEVGPEDSNPDGVESGQVLVNEAEIVYATDEEGEVHDDIDSTPDDEQGNDGEIDDNEINGGGPDAGEDEDDDDIAVVTVECYQDPGVSNTIQVCLGCDEAEVVINLFESLAGRPNIGGDFAEGELIFMDEEGNPIFIDLSDPENVVIPGTLDRSLDYQITYTIPAVNDCPEMVSTLTIDVIDIQNLACEGFTNISLGEDCEATITPDLILQGALTCASSLTVNLLDQAGNSIGNTVNNDHIGDIFFVQLIDEQCDNVCWGQLLVEDKRRPTIECPENVDGFDGKDFICTDLDAIYQQPSSLSITGSPVVDDNCTPVDELIVTFNDLLLPYDPQCGIATILRTFTVEDASGNTNFCTQQIQVRPPTLEDVMIPENETVEINCNDDYDQLPNGNPTTEETGGPSVMTALDMFDIPGNGSYCNIAAEFQDGPRIETCENTFKFVRTWTIYDWCEIEAEPLTFSQLIKVGDFTAPTVTLPTQDLDFDGVPDEGPLFYSTSNEDCTANFLIPAGDATDNCDANPTVTAYIFGFGNMDVAAFGPYQVGEAAFSIPEGEHILRYIARDACGNADTVDIDLAVGDRTAPVAICEDGLDISIGGAGEAILTPDDIDRASYDDCTEILREIAIVDEDDNLLTPWSASITLDCDDLGIIRVALRVTDDGNRDGLFQPGIDNSNVCWLEVLVEDKLAPLCVAPSPVVTACTDEDVAGLPQDLNAAMAADPVETAALLDLVFGAATGVDNCDGVTVEQSVLDQRSSCGTGVIVRTFSVTDAVGLTSQEVCTQTVTILGVHDYTIVFPADVGNEQCVQPDYNAVTFEERGCDLLTVTTDIDTFSADADECYKLRITYEVLNWCEYNTEEDPYVVPRDADNDDFLEENTWVHVVPNGLGTLTDDVAWLDNDNNRNNGFISPLDDDDPNGQVPGSSAQPYGTDESRGAFLYRQFVKVYDDIAPELTIVNPDPIEDIDGSCDETVELGFMLTDNCTSVDEFSATAELDAFFGDTDGDGSLTLADFVPSSDPTLQPNVVNNQDSTFTVSFDVNLPLGQHAVRVIASDGCGNTEVGLIIFEVVDTKAPTPVCINGLTATLMPDGDGGGMAAIWASEYVASVSDDCTGPVEFAIYRSSEAAADGFAGPMVGDTGLILTCDDLGLLPVRVYAIDAAGNADYCETTLLVQAFQDDVCAGSGDGGNILGLITTELDIPVAGVEVGLSGESGASETIVTDVSGTFAFTELEAELDYTVTPTHYEGYMNGVTTADIVEITQYILGMNPLDSPYEYIAADVDGNEEINVLDLVSIRRLILGLADNFPNDQPSWRFIAADHDFSDLHNPWAEAFPEVNNHNDLVGLISNSDFIAAKLGDVNGTVIANSTQDPEERSFRGDLEFEMDGLEMEAGETYHIPVRSANLKEVLGYQFTFEYDHLAVELVAIEPGLVPAGSFGLRFADQGLITTSWNWANGAPVENWTGDEVLFTLVLRAQLNTELNEVLAAGSRFTAAEAYGTDGELRNIALVYNLPEIIDGGYVLHQNSPNPFRRITTIGYELPRAMEVSIAVTDVRGRLVRLYEMQADAGYNRLEVTKRQLGGGSGVYNYTITAGDWTSSRRMVVLD